MKKEQRKKALKEFAEALDFATKTHQADIDRIDSLTGLMNSLDDFFYEYVSVVLASGFKAQIAARLTPQIVACQGDLDKMQTIFKNKVKTKSIATVWKNKAQWNELRESFKSVDDLTKLPYIGEITKYHLGRNIGLLSHPKPDLHLVRWCKTINGIESEENVTTIIDEIAKEVSKKPGTTDFILWVWLSHDRGTEQPCCHGGYALR